MAKKLLTDDQDFYLRKIAPGKSVKECTDLMNQKFNTCFSETQIHGYKSRYHIVSGKKPWEFIDHQSSRKFPKEVRYFIYRNYKGVGHKQMSELIKEKLDYDMTPRQVKSFYCNNKLNSGLTGYFEKGHNPKNKGKRQTEFMSQEAIERTKATRFQNGSVPHNTDSIGAVKELDGGYLWVKINNIPRVKKRVNWKPLHELMYEKYYGKVPEGYLVFFKNRNKRDFSKENLGIMTREELLKMNHKHGITEFGEITESYLALTRLELKIKEKEKNE